MTNPIRPKPIPIDLDKPRALLFDLNAMAALEDEYGDSKAAFQAVEDGSMKAIRFVLWVGLQRDATDKGETLTLEDAGALASFGGLRELAPVLVSALAESSPEEVEAKMAALKADQADPKVAQSAKPKAKKPKA